MKAAVILGVRHVEVQDVPAPEIGRPGDVLVRVRAVGICGSDLHNYVSGEIGGDPVPYPFIPGHECAGTVELVGPEVTRVRPGDAVVVEPAVSCGACDQCLAGRRHTCRAIRFMGHAGELCGGMAEFAAAPERNVVVLPEGMGPVDGALAEPLSIALHAVNLAGPPEPGQAAAILGSGPIGLCTALALRDGGSGPLYMTDKVEARVRAAGTAGAAWAGNPDRTDIVSEILAREPHGLPVVFECCGDQAALDQAVELLRPGGALVVVGIPLAPRVSFPSGRARRKEIRVQNVRRQNACLEEAVELIASGRVAVGFLATHQFPLAEAPLAFATAADYRDGVLKALVRPS